MFNRIPVRGLLGILCALALGFTACINDAPATVPPQTTQDTEATVSSNVAASPTPVPVSTRTASPNPAMELTPVPIATATSAPVSAPDLLPRPTTAPEATPTPSPTSPSLTPRPEMTPRPTPTTAPTSAPVVLSSIYDTNNVRWLQRNYPALARQIHELSWVQDGLSDLERSSIDELLYMAAEDVANLGAVLDLGWVEDGISEWEYKTLDTLGHLDTPYPGNLHAALNVAWVQDGVSETEQDIIDELGNLEFDAPDMIIELLSMPFLRSPDSTDSLAIGGMEKLADRGRIDALTGQAIFQDGITDDETTLVAAVGALADSDEIRRVLEPGVAAIETVALGTTLTPHLRISIVRTESQSRPGTVESVRDGVEFVENAVGVPLPVDHVIIILSDKAVTREYSGTNFGFAFSYKPEYEAAQGTREWRRLQTGFVHETAHYFWSGNEDWIDEGLANFVEYQFGLSMGLSHGQQQVRREGCEAHDLEMVSEWDPDFSDVDRYHCAYYLGQPLFQDLHATIGTATFTERLREFYLLSVAAQELDLTPGIAEVRQVFSEQAAIVDRHWSGKLNAPENLPFDEGLDRVSHDLVEWDEYPTFDEGYVSLSGRLLGNSILNHDVGTDGFGKLQNFSLRRADSRQPFGNILSPLPSGRTWNLTESDSVVASTYVLDHATGDFSVTFQFDGNVEGNPMDYVVLVYGFQDNSRTATIGQSADLLAYARIRVPE